jgi:hypothetical protein
LQHNAIKKHKTEGNNYSEEKMHTACNTFYLIPSSSKSSRRISEIYGSDNSSERVCIRIWVHDTRIHQEKKGDSSGSKTSSLLSFNK